jgi:hypothetical protein
MASRGRGWEGASVEHSLASTINSNKILDASLNTGVRVNYESL